MLLILAGVSLNAVFSQEGIFSRAEKAGNKYNEAKAKEILETVLMADAQTEKYTNPKYNQDDFLDQLIKKEIPETEIKGDVVIIDNWAFELDRSVPKIKDEQGLGQADKLVFPTVTISDVQLSNDYRTATFTVKALEETNGINKIEIWINGEKLDTYDKTYTNIKTEISEDFTVNRNGTYTVKVYGKLMISKTVKVEGIVPVVKFSPNGSTEWKREHSTTITVEQTGEAVTEIKYLWKIGENEPQASEFKETCIDNSTITGKGLTGKYHLWVLIKTESGKTNICGSEEFWFDNEGPKVTLTPKPASETSFTLTATASDNYNGISKYEFYVDYKLVDTQTVSEGTATYTWNGTEMEENKKCYVMVYDGLGNPTKASGEARTKLYCWRTYNVDSSGTKKVITFDATPSNKTYSYYYSNPGFGVVSSYTSLDGGTKLSAYTRFSNNIEERSYPDPTYIIQYQGPGYKSVGTLLGKIVRVNTITDTGYGSTNRKIEYYCYLYLAHEENVPVKVKR